MLPTTPSRTQLARTTPSRRAATCNLGSSIEEYVLIRPYERSLVDQMTRELQFLVMDELHVYRGRQGADVAMLLRRVRQRAGGRDLQLVGTSATLATEGTRQERNATIAEVGSTLFGVPVPAANVVDESLRRMATVAPPRTPDELRAAVETPVGESGRPRGAAPTRDGDGMGVRGYPLPNSWDDETEDKPGYFALERD